MYIFIIKTCVISSVRKRITRTRDGGCYRCAHIRTRISCSVRGKLYFLTLNTAALRDCTCGTVVVNRRRVRNGWQCRRRRRSSAAAAAAGGRLHEQVMLARRRPKLLCVCAPDKHKQPPENGGQSSLNTDDRVHKPAQPLSSPRYLSVGVYFPRFACVFECHPLHFYYFTTTMILQFSDM